jgi:hypothetical protein
MSEPSYSHQMIIQYLLGALPQAETDRLDELSVTDDEFVGALSVAERDLVDAYVQNELAGAELKRFQSYYLASPLRRARVRFAEAFQASAESNTLAQAAVIPTENQARERQKGGWLSALFTQRLAWQWGAALAALIVLIAGSWLLFENRRLRQQMSQTQASQDVLLRREQDLKAEIESRRLKTEQELAQFRNERERLEQELKQAQSGAKPTPDAGSIVSLTLPPPLRGTSQVPSISIKPGTSQLAAQLQLEVADYSTYRVALIDPASNQTLWRSRSLKPKVRGDRVSLEVGLRPNLLKPQIYIFRVSGNGSEAIGDYAFKVVK